MLHKKPVLKSPWLFSVFLGAVLPFGCRQADQLAVAVAVGGEEDMEQRTTSGGINGLGLVCGVSSEASGYVAYDHDLSVLPSMQPMRGVPQANMRRERRLPLSFPESVHDIVARRYASFVFGRAVNTPDESGNTPLMEAIENNDEASVIMLLADPHVDVDAQGAHGQTALHEAALLGDELIIRVLLSREADVNMTNSYGCTALHEAALLGNRSIVRVLLDHGAEVNAVNNHGETALHKASKYGEEATVRMLLENGAGD